MLVFRERLPALDHLSALATQVMRELAMNADGICLRDYVRRFGATLALIIAGARPDGVHMTPIGFLLRMNLRVAVDLGC